ncbi:uncharacterized protein EKO05_0006789 [Ascochyta rabiei]|uniref:uncharacterized protein n=1 Tax=Didymella rabiei TaxID=5454 RepID=UPI001902A719|nr:uncharacterized protein EKO05_0006789 [Ascochyta rabiei]UPX16383.1 hypothetical protein EKO05_0006789 [Ascochyta rabiei]
MSRLDSRTSSPSRSIWLQIPEDTFRQHLVDLEKRTNAVPVEPQIFNLEHNTDACAHTLPLYVEQQLADDFAFLAAIEEGAQSVAAACLEEHVQPAGLTVRFAALDLTLSDQVKAALQQIADGLVSSATNLDNLMQVEVLFEQIVKLHFRRLLARLRSNKWEKPKYLLRQHKKPLWQDFANMIHRVQFLFTKKEAALRDSVETKLHGLAALYQAFESSDSGSHNEFPLLQDLIKASYQICKAEHVALFAQRLEDSVKKTPTSKVASAIKCLRQIEKIAAHWRIATFLVGVSRKYPSLFHSKLQLAFLTPYKSVPTEIGYETWANSCHVHAEVQLVVYYDLHLQSASCVSKSNGSRHATSQQSYYRPRVIGTSKWLCYLCYLFLRSHDCFVPANTHGRLYDQWTVPDLAEYGDHLRARYRSIVNAVDEEVVKETTQVGAATKEDSGLVKWRAEPMTSRQNLLSMESSI